VYFWILSSVDLLIVVTLSPTFSPNSSALRLDPQMEKPKGGPVAVHHFHNPNRLTGPRVSQ
jgi:hypothetical protein